MRTLTDKHTLRTPVRASVGFTLTGIASRGIALLSTAVLTRLLTPAQFGLYPLYAARLSLVNVFATMNLGGGILYRGMQRAGVSGRDAFVRRVLCIGAVPLLVTAAVCLLASRLFPAHWGMPTSITALMMLQIASGLPLTLFQGRCRFLYRPKAYALCSLSVALLTPIVTYWLIRGLSLGALSRLIAPAAVGVAVAVPLLVYLLRLPRGQGDTVFPMGRYALSQGAILLPYALSLCAVEEVGRLLLGTHAGAGSLAVFGIAYAVGTAPMLLFSGVQAVLQPWLMRKLSAGEGASVRQVLRLVCLGVCALTVALSLAAPELIAVLAPASYAEALRYVVPISLSVLPHVLFLTFTAVALHRERAGRVTVAAVLSGGVSCLLYALLIPRYGAAAAAPLSAVAYGLLALSSYAVMRRAGKDTASVLDGRYTLLLFFVTAGLCAVATRLYGVPVCRGVLLVLLLVLTAVSVFPYRRLLREV